MDEVKDLAQIIWDYHHLNQQIIKSDAILVLGSYDTTVAERGTDIFLAGYAPYVIFSGGHGRHTKGFIKTEAEILAEIAKKRNVPEEKIIIENKSTNTGDNIIFTRKLLQGRGLDFKSFIVVHKPYMERRTYATFQKIWPEAKVAVTSAMVSFEDYIKKFSIDEVINIMVGDLQRLMIYPDKDYAIPQDVPIKVQEAYDRLVSLGYTNELIT